MTTAYDARDGQDSLRCLLAPWRTGGSVGRTIYAVFGDGGHEHARDDEATVIGMMDTAQLAEAAVVAHNEWRRKHYKRNC
jgi:hypothetical protein